MPDALARLLRLAMVDGHVPLSRFSKRSLNALRSLFDAGALHPARRGGGRVIEVRDPETLASFYRSRYPSGGLPVQGPPRTAAVGMRRNAKRARASNREPILLRAIQPVSCHRSDRDCDLRAVTLRTGAACLILESGNFWTLSAEVAIVENLECFLHFETMSVPASVALYASGRLSELALRWLASPELSGCRFTHCGDYDPVGLDEFLRLKAAVGERARLHLPPTLPALVAKYGRPELLRDSGSLLGRIRGASDPAVRDVLAILDETGLGLEQEVLLLEDAEQVPVHGGEFSANMNKNDEAGGLRVNE